MPHGLKNTPATFQRAADIILSIVKWQYALVYIHDIISYLRNVEEHFDHFRRVFQLLKKPGLTLKLQKYFLFKSSVDSLGHVVLPGRLQVSTTTQDAIKQAKLPTNQTELRSFSGLCNVFRWFMPNFSRTA